MSDDATYALNGGESSPDGPDPDETLPALSTLTQDEINTALESLDYLS